MKKIWLIFLLIFTLVSCKQEILEENEVELINSGVIEITEVENQPNF